MCCVTKYLGATTIAKIVRYSVLVACEPYDLVNEDLLYLSQGH